jgi:hypothetical protein
MIAIFTERQGDVDPEEEDASERKRSAQCLKERLVSVGAEDGSDSTLAQVIELAWNVPLPHAEDE